MTTSLNTQQFLSELSITQLLHSSDSSKIFPINHESAKYCLKVFHVNKDPGFTSKGRDLCRWRCEIEAYKLLSAAGACEQGFVPKLHAVFEDIDPLTPTLVPHLNAFLDDVHRPCAGFTPNYTRDRIQKAILGIKAVHHVRVVHNDPYRKNVLIVPGVEGKGGDERVVWVDFDIAQILDETGQQLNT
ncbi:hypothetical protein P170DRAFT_450563 [Aspergillus steynii IBT 23096]|uniref:Protein kinase domain-containing protein n=1 Tax=Aspergillus steynii IBT 23096 TaxID=1392250 RepID=A0A2I2FUZ6_9EURO|nr:uncharacterized protein P170DRAFT_450563 [Aspergillus steynii IBT 23096]PLB44463.1 hypothetical protein P170DRAFT_450563 [Aspergillus steynii IBT 23096]